MLRNKSLKIAISMLTAESKRDTGSVKGQILHLDYSVFRIIVSFLVRKNLRIISELTVHNMYVIV
jgi:hypothetical protein